MDGDFRAGSAVCISALRLSTKLVNLCRNRVELLTSTSKASVRVPNEYATFLSKESISGGEGISSSPVCTFSYRSARVVMLCKPSITAGVMTESFRWLFSSISWNGKRVVRSLATSEVTRSLIVSILVWFSSKSISAV